MSPIAKGVLLSLVLGLGATLFAQTAPGVPGAATNPATASPATGGAAPASGGAATASGGAALPLGYGKLRLGMSRDEAIAELKSDPLFAWRGPEDVSLLPTPNQSLIEVSGLSFVRRAFLQFDAGKLWVIILELADDRIDHYSVWTSLVAKYGQPSSLDPSASIWENGKVRLSLERPLTLRYVDLAELQRLNAGASAQLSVEEIDRQGFLGGL